MPRSMFRDVRTIACEYAELCELLQDINRVVAIVQNLESDTHSSGALAHLKSFLSLSALQQQKLITIAANHTEIRILFNECAHTAAGAQVIILWLKECYLRYQPFYEGLPLKKNCVAFLQDLICDYESLDDYSAGHEKLFDELIGLTKVDEIEISFEQKAGHNNWRGAAEGRYAYASSLQRLKRFYGTTLIKNGDIVYDLGSGYGHAMFYGALKYPSALFKGVELIDERVVLANSCCNQLALQNLEFYAGDARHFDFSDGDVFYLYSPFSRELKVEIFNRLVRLGAQKSIHIFVYDTDQLGIFENHPEVFSKLDTHGETFVSVTSQM